MRYALVLVAATLFAPASAFSADPPITFQTHPLDRVLADLRAAADLVGGEKAVKAVNREIKDTFGEKGFEGLDINQPVVGYVILAPKPEDITAVVVLPITGEKEFLALCDRANSVKHKDLGKGLYELPPLDPRYKARMRFSDGHAYIAYGAKPEPALDPKELVPAGKLYDPAERGVIAAKFHFDRLTPEVKRAIPTYMAEFKKEFGTGGFGALTIIGFGQAEQQVYKDAGAEMEKMFTRYALLLGGADTATVRLSVDVPTSDLVVEATLTPKPDTPLAKEIADRKPTGNQFGGLLTADTVAGFKTRLPFFNDELKAAGVKALEAGQKEAANTAKAAGKAAADELFKGLIRTVKTGEADIVGGVRGPDKDGEFTFVGAIAFEDPAAFEKEFKKFYEADSPQNERDRMKWDAAKAGTVNIHTYKFPNDNGFLNPAKIFGGDKCTLAFAFAPKGVFFVLGPDPIPAMKDALAVKPADSPVLDVVLNPARISKLVEKAGGKALEAERALGREDKLLSATSLRVTGGKELTVRFAVNLRLFPRAAAVDTLDADDKKPDPFEKK